ncbi:hypothetical protein EIP91_003075 [Steccherinum ochraceum]|uniref:Plasmid pRiA4b Orf3-like domain-containing protein n=1 Tax=Steccherinum ochraceum TaxID=92696 RepID=A0A4R0RAZ0_9APHY|nr:hypothetical protein EIP91_003075 [Steccherinum ochraceum]
MALENGVTSGSTAVHDENMERPEQEPSNTSSRSGGAGPSTGEKRIRELVPDLWDKDSSHQKRKKVVREQRRTLPEPCADFIELRFQLARFRGVYRIVRLPLTFTFANLYMFLLYIFGWSGDHAHKFNVVGHVKMYSGNYKKGDIKSCERPAPPEPDMHEDPHGWMAWSADYEMIRREPYVRVKPRREGFERKTESHTSWNGDRQIEMSEERDDADMTLGEVWHRKKRLNVTKGSCSNSEIGIKFEYDLSASWDVHITVNDPEKPWFAMDPPNNLPVVVVAKGSPPLEDIDREIYDEPAANKKKVSPLIFDRESFKKYLDGEFGSCARKTELAIYDVNEERLRLRAVAQAR